MIYIYIKGKKYFGGEDILEEYKKIYWKSLRRYIGREQKIYWRSLRRYIGEE